MNALNEKDSYGTQHRRDMMRSMEYPAKPKDEHWHPMNRHCTDPEMGPIWHDLAILLGTIAGVVASAWLYVTYLQPILVGLFR